MLANRLTACVIAIVVVGITIIADAQDGDDSKPGEKKLSRAEVMRLIDEKVAATKSNDVEVRREAAEAISRLCYEHKQLADHAAPVLFGLFADKDDEVQGFAVVGIAYIGESTIETVRKKMDDPSSRIRVAAINAAERMIGLRPSLLGDIQKRLMDESLEVRKNVSSALWFQKDHSVATLSAILNMAKSESGEERGHAFTILSLLTCDVKDEAFVARTKQIVLNGLEDQNAEARAEAVYSVTHLQLDTELRFDAMMKVIQDNNLEVVHHAVSVLNDLKGIESKLGQKVIAEAAIRVFREYSKRPDEDWDKRAIVKFLGKIGSQAKEVVPDLLECFHGKELELMAEAAVAIWRIDKQTAVLIPTLRNRLRGNYDEATWACDAIAQIGPDLAPLVDDVFAVHANAKEDLLIKSSVAVQSLASKDPQVVAAFVNALNHKNRDFVDDVRFPLRSLLPDVLPQLIQSLDVQKKQQCVEIIKILSSLNTEEGKPAIEPLKKLLSCDVRVIRFYSAVALAKIATEPAAIPALLEFYENQERESSESIEAENCLFRFRDKLTPFLLAAMRMERIETQAWIFIWLARCDVNSKTSVETLKKLLSHPRRLVRQMSAIALGNITGSVEYVPLIEKSFDDSKSKKAIQNLKHDAGDLCISAWKGLIRCGDEGRKSAISRLREFINLRLEFRLLFFHAFDKSDEGLVASLERMHELADGDVQAFCAVLLAKIQHTPERLQKISGLIHEGKNVVVRTLAIDVISEYRIMAKSLLPSLRQLFDDPNEDLRSSARLAIYSIEEAIRIENLIRDLDGK